MCCVRVESKYIVDLLKNGCSVRGDSAISVVICKTDDLQYTAPSTPALITGVEVRDHLNNTIHVMQYDIYPLLATRKMST